jgi:hypothetical protein
VAALLSEGSPAATYRLGRHLVTGATRLELVK